MLKDISNKDSNSTNSQNQGLNRTKILPCSSKDASRDSVELKFEQLVDQLGELISSENTLVINSNEEKKKPVTAIKSSLPSQDHLIKFVKEYWKEDEDEKIRKRLTKKILLLFLNLLIKFLNLYVIIIKYFYYLLNSV